MTSKDAIQKVRYRRLSIERRAPDDYKSQVMALFEGRKKTFTGEGRTARLAMDDMYEAVHNWTGGVE